MKIVKGGTRIVILTGHKSIKIGRIRLVRTIPKLVSLLFSQRRRNSFFTEYGNTLFIATRSYLFSGILANRNEFFYYQMYKDPRVMPTLRMFLGGCINIQERGTPITEEDLSLSNPLKPEVSLTQGADLLRCRQYCYGLDGSVRVVDYGSRVACKVLQASLTN